MIFISYRRPEADDHSGRLTDRLQHWFDPGMIFYDKSRNGIDMVDDFPAEIDAGLERAHVVPGNLASTLQGQGELAGARTLQESALATRRRNEGEPT